MSKEIENGVRFIHYYGYHSKSDKAKIAYMIQGDKILFTATGEKDGSPPTTINGVEQVIKAICETEGINFKDFYFYDLQTKAMYPRHVSFDTFALDLLIFDEDTIYPSVIRWETVYDSYIEGIKKDISPLITNLLLTIKKEE